MCSFLPPLGSATACWSLAIQRDPVGSRKRVEACALFSQPSPVLSEGSYCALNKEPVGGYGQKGRLGEQAGERSCCDSGLELHPSPPLVALLTGESQTPANFL